jgi:hypothetical protein
MAEVIVPQVKVKGQVLKVVHQFKYVGSIQSDTADMEAEVKTRSHQMLAAFALKRKVLFENRRLALSVRLRGYKTFVMNAGTYGCETWNTTTEALQDLESTHFQMLKRVFGYRWFSRKSASDLIFECREAGVDMLPVEATVRLKQLEYLGHVLRMPTNRLPIQLLFGELDAGKKLAGGQEMTLKRVIKTNFEVFNILPKVLSSEWIGKPDATFTQDILRAALNRSRWRKLVKTVGLRFFMDNWYRVKAEESHKRHLKGDPNAMFPATRRYKRLKHTKIMGVTLADALETGAVTGERLRDHQEIHEDCVFWLNME